MNKHLVDLQEYVREISHAYGERDAYRYIVDGRVIHKTFKDFERDINSVASYFVNQGWHGKHIAIIGSSSYAWVVTFLAIACSANVVIPIDKMLPENEILNLLSVGDTDAVFISREFEHLIPAIQSADNRVSSIISFAGEDYRAICKTEHVDLPAIDPDAMAEILFTSGTTGVSKGVMLSQRNIVANINDIHRMDYAQNLKCDAVVMSVLPIHHTFELTVDNLGVLYCGATVCINDRLENIVANLNRFKPSVILVVPTIAEIFYKKIMDGISTKRNRRKMKWARRLNKLCRFFQIDARRFIYRSILHKLGGNLTNVIVGGAALRPEIAEAFDEFGINMYQGYGMTECAPLIAANYPVRNRIGSVGRPVSYMEVKIIDGEIVVKGDGVMLGYYKNPTATEEAFYKNGWLRTGDLGHFDNDGYLYITGRSKNLIILDNGKNIYPEELEGYISVIDGVKDVLVYESKGKICAAILSTDPASKRLQKEIRQKINEVNATLPTYKKIVSIAFISREFPKTTTLKIKRKEAIRMVNDLVAKNTVPYVAPTTREQKRIIAAFESVLGATRMGIHDDFFDMGGDSLGAFEVAAILGIQAQEIYENPTAEKLEAILIFAEEEALAEESRGADVNALIRENANVERCADGMRDKYILLTGATGFLGSHILRELMRRKANVICLVRDEARLLETLRFYFPKSYEFFRFETVKGDITHSRFYLEDEEYKRLTERVGMVIHTAANVSHAGRYVDFERTNVLGTQNVIDFCRAAGAVLQHTSTASVHGSGTVEQRKPDAVFDEFCLDIGQKYVQNVYIHSKYKAEEKVLLARKDGLAANIFRIGNLTWRSSDGVFQKNVQDNGFLGRCKGLLKIGMYSKELSEYPIDFTPVDECAEAFVRLSLDTKVNNVYHLYNPNVFTIEKIGKRFFKNIRLVSREKLEASLRESISDKDVAILSFYNSIASSSRNIPVKNDFTVTELKRLGFKWSKISIRYLFYMRKLS